jgi:hypothetical protein
MNRILFQLSNLFLFRILEPGSVASPELLSISPGLPSTSRRGRQLSWGYGPFRSIIERDAITRIGYVTPLRLL